MPLPEHFWADLDRAMEAMTQHRERLLSIPGVRAVGAGQERVGGKPTGRAAIVVTVEKKLGPRQIKTRGSEFLPDEIEGIPVDVVEPRTGARQERPGRSEEARAIAAKQKAAPRWLAEPNVTGIGVGYKVAGGERTDAVAIRLYVAEKLPQAEIEKRGLRPIPAEIGGVPTDVIEQPPMKPAADPSGSRADRHDPLVGGISIGTGNRPFYRGTLGTIAFDRSSGEQLVLSNEHVLDGAIGEDVIQPAPIGLDDTFEVGFQLNICNPLHFFRLDTPNTPLGTILAGGAVAAAVAAALSDEIDPTRRGQEATNPASGAHTLGERHKVRFEYPELPIPGTAFKIGTEWRYERQTTAGDLSHEVREERKNPHVLLWKALVTDRRRYQPGDTVELFAAILPDREKRHCSAYHCVGLLTPTAADQLFPVVLHEAGPRWGEVLERILEVLPKEERQDELASLLRLQGCFYYGTFVAGVGVPIGAWRHYLYVQTVNFVPEGVRPEIAAQTIGGLPVSQNTKPTLDVACGPFVFEDGTFDIELI